MSKYNKKNNESSDESSSEPEEEVIVKKQVKKQTKSSNNSDSSNDKKSAKKMSSSDSGSDESEEKPVGKLGKKDLKNLERQKEIFEELKELMGISQNKLTVSSFKIDEIKDDIMENLFPEIVKAFNFKIWATQSEKQTFHHMRIIRKMFKYFGYDISYKGTSKVIDGKRKQGRKYYIIKSI